MAASKEILPSGLTLWTDSLRCQVECGRFFAFETFNINFTERHGHDHRFWRVVFMGLDPGEYWETDVKVFLQNEEEARNFVIRAAERNWKPSYRFAKEGK